jgi:hypothetical protein
MHQDLGGIYDQKVWIICLPEWKSESGIKSMSSLGLLDAGLLLNRV